MFFLTRLCKLVRVQHLTIFYFLEIMMRTIIAGSRSIKDESLVEHAIFFCGWKPTTILSGGAVGVDTLGEKYAAYNNIPLEIYPAKWRNYGKSAGILRNIEMANKADALIAIWDGSSKGTEHMIRTAEKLGLKTYVLVIS